MARFRPGWELIAEDQCPLGATTPASCYVCAVGHPQACHYPETCEEAQSEYCLPAKFNRGLTQIETDRAA